MAKSQILTFGLDDSPSGSVTQYMPIHACGEVATWTSTEADTKLTFSVPGTLVGMWIQRAAGPGVGSTSQYYLRKNGSNTAMTLSFTGTETVKQAFHKVDVAVGDYFTISHVPTLSPTASEAWGMMEFRPDDPSQCVMIGSTGDVSLPGSGTRYLCLHGGANASTTAFDVSTLIINSRGGQFGNIDNFYVSLDTTPGSSASRTFEIFKNGVGTGMSVTITGLNTTGSTTGSVAISDGDSIYIQQTSSASPALSKAQWGIAISTDWAGDYLMNGCGSGTLPTTGGSYEYNRIATGNSNWTTIKQNRSRMGAAWGHFMVGIGLKTSRAPDTLDPTSSNKAYELYIESPSSGAQRAYVLDNATQNTSPEFCWGARRFNTWNVRALAYNTPASANAQWAVQMRYLGG